MLKLLVEKRLFYRLSLSDHLGPFSAVLVIELGVGGHHHHEFFELKLRAWNFYSELLSKFMKLFGLFFPLPFDVVGVHLTPSKNLLYFVAEHLALLDPCNLRVQTTVRVLVPLGVPLHVCLQELQFLPGQLANLLVGLVHSRNVLDCRRGLTLSGWREQLGTQGVAALFAAFLVEALGEGELQLVPLGQRGLPLMLC